MRWPVWRAKVTDHSMQPALNPGDWLFVHRTVWPGRPLRVRPGQFVIAHHPGRPGLLIVKRAVRRDPGGWWLESDNPGAGAVDSRIFGPVPPALIEGRVMWRYWPLRGAAGSGRR